MADEPVIEADDRNWEKTVEQGSKPVAVMFYSPTCAFCHQMEPYFRNYAEIQGFRGLCADEYHGKPMDGRTLRYPDYPTFKFFCDGKPVQEMVGAIYPALLKKTIDEVLVHGKECAKNSTTINYDITGYG